MTKGYRTSAGSKSATSKSSSDDTILDISAVKNQAESFFVKNRSFLTIGFIALIVLVGGYLGYKYLYVDADHKAALEQMYQAEMLFEKDSFEMALNNPGGGFSGFKEIAENFGHTPAGNLAKYYAGICELKLGNYDAAKSYIEDFDGKGEVMPILKYNALGDITANLLDYEAAIKHYEKAISVRKNDFLTPWILKKLGILKESLGDTEGALKAYNEIKENYLGAPDGVNIERYILNLKPELH
ncbi:MAG: tetratricopeptide repeat protein [Saprospiraceae bacterium]|nr:tetratricopeptide repeat protein [Saprospiraceae bacterium]MBK7811897.1 tetratricopeptide repeat protein [Saprospiraceae bacterium]MBK9631902.1 tetratricopeptide repeat protein [Saprospiraceae bacterium]